MRAPNEVMRYLWLRGTRSMRPCNRKRRRSYVAAQQLRDVRPDIAMAKAGRTEGEQTEGLHQRENASIAEAKTRRALGVDDEGLSHGVQVIVADLAVVAQMFDAQEAPVGGKADLPQGG
jgi:hypothetical protein